ncbi:AAA family ATPase [uncultured Bacteroides sp.]|uniref:AAA family ATPase n=1 Tax=uncultured Bacteroides sp. TaxID=162156 RepID=UPI002AAA9DA2|nr:AAA family ATPase [uncultured Bacteroides sp.]
MKRLELQKLIIRNFGCFRNEFEVEFGPELTIVKGGNGQGKTTIYSAMSWLLFGKDAYNRSDFDIKHIENGQKLDKADVEVEGFFRIFHDDKPPESVNLKRVLHEIWIQKTDTYKGDETHYFWNDAPIQAGEYSDRIEKAIAPESHFRMMTNASYFLSMKPADQRDLLCKMGGVRTMQEIAEGNAGWNEWIKSLQGKDYEDWRNQTLAEKSRLKKEIDKIQPAIDAIEKLKPAARNWAELEEKQATLRKRISDIDSSLQSAASQYDSNLAKKRAIIEEKDKAVQRISAIHNEINDKKDTERRRIEENTRLQNKDREDLLKSINSKTGEIKSLELSRESFNIKRTRLNGELEDLFKKYGEKQKETFVFNAERPMCPLLQGHECVDQAMKDQIADNREKAERDFNANKAKNLDSILTEGKAKQAEFDLSKENEEAITNKVINLQKEIDILQAQLSNTPIIKSDTVIEEDTIQGIRELKNEKAEKMRFVSQKTEEIDNFNAETTTETGELKKQKSELQDQLTLIVQQLTDKKRIQETENEISKLRENAKKLGQQLTDLDNAEFIGNEINRATIEDATERVNKLFQVTNWVMFEQYKNGSWKDCCKPEYVSGVSKSTNTGALINIGLDICNVISKYEGISVPTFIDGSESVNETIPMEGQIIKNYVAPKGTPLTVEIIK